jgi:hypothetical protein
MKPTKELTLRGHEKHEEKLVFTIEKSGQEKRRERRANKRKK